MNLESIQDELQRQDLDGWLFFDHHGRDPLAYRILGLGAAHHVTRRWYYLIPAKGEPRALVHRIEPYRLDLLPGTKHYYAGWQEHGTALRQLLRGVRKVAMQYSPLCEIPYVAMVDAGTVEHVRQAGCQVASSAELVQYFDATLTQAGLDSHLEAGRRVDSVRAEAFQFIAERLRNALPITEIEVADLIRERFSALSLLTENGPTVAVNQNSANPHYEPTRDRSFYINHDDFVLIDMWARMDQPESVFYDITWTGYCGPQVPERIQDVFTVVREARDAAVALVLAGCGSGSDIRGFEIDDAARNHIRAAGYGNAFIHRTGHSIATEVHGNGANMDNFELHDERRLIPWTCFSIEPGIYLDTFGVRSELNMFITGEEAMVTGKVQYELVRVT